MAPKESAARPLEIPTGPAHDLEVPEVFSRLRDVVYNLWWSWSRPAQLLFHRLDPTAWRHYRNPIEVLIDLDPVRWRTLAGDGEFAHAYHEVVESFDAYMAADRTTWFKRRHGGYRGGPVAYFSTEFGWHECLHIYSGGLGILSGDHCKSASDLGIPFVGVGLMYRHGYFRQTIDAEGTQQHFYPDYDAARLPLLPVVDDAGREVYVAVELPGRSVQLRIWRVLIGRVPVLLLDSDLPINHPADRAITSTLYVHGREMRLCQEILLGLGGRRALRALNIEPAMWHLNEGHSALLSLERLSDVAEGDATALADRLDRISRNAVFTTHTPVAAGNEIFDAALIRKYFDRWSDDAGLDIEQILALGRTGEGERDDSFNLTALALRSTVRTNAVSELHGKVATDMWQPLVAAERLAPIEYVTNGVHPRSWIGPELCDLLQRHLGPDFDDQMLEPGFAESVAEIPDHEIWSAHLTQKRRLVDLIRECTLEQFARHGRSPDELRGVGTLIDPDLLTVGFARRFATYKRADLILHDIERLKALVSNSERPLQIVFAGKAHPADRPGQEIIRRICQASLDPALYRRMIFLESYDIRIGRRLVQGVDVWLNTPRRPNEASGTSGMKAAMNGVLNCSILDGWWCEGNDPAHGWAIGNANPDADEAEQDRADASALYDLLADEIAPLYYARNEQGLPEEWIRRMKSALAQLAPQFSAARMVREYTERFYLPAGAGDLRRPDA